MWQTVYFTRGQNSVLELRSQAEPAAENVCNLSVPNGFKVGSLAFVILFLTSNTKQSENKMLYYRSVITPELIELNQYQ